MSNYFKYIRNPFSIFLAILIMCGSFSHIIYFKVQQYSIKQEIKQKLKKGVPKNELFTFTFSEDEIEANKEIEFIEEHEFRYKGKMYDIVYQQRQNGKIIYQCVSDEQETTLFAQLEQLVEEQSKKNQEKNQQLFKLLNFQFIVSNISISKLIFPYNEFSSNLYHYSIKTCDSKITSPPPQHLI
jgi:hypothetical protein